MTSTPLVAATAFVTTAALVVPVILLLRRVGMLDRPTARSSHDRPTPRGGGLAIGVGALVALAAADRLAGDPASGLVAAAGGIGFIGLVDDVRPVPALRRLFAQLVPAAVALVWLLHGLHESPVVGAVVVASSLLWIVWFANAFNFMDGINGLAIAQVVVVGATWWIVGDSEGARVLETGGAIIGAAALAFAPANSPRARAFLGDTGSYFLGSWIAAIAVLGLREGVAPEAVLAPLALFTVDPGFTLARRLARRARWDEPHREHVYQRLVLLGWSHTRTTALIAAMIVACALLGSVSESGSDVARVLADVGIAAAVLTYLLMPGLVARTATARLSG